MKSHETNTVRRSTSCRTPWVITACLVIIMTVGMVPTADAVEGYDLMRVITSQWVKPSIMLAVDTSKSMKKDFVGNWRDVDWQGGYHSWNTPKPSGCDCIWNQVCTQAACDSWTTETVCTRYKGRCLEGHYYQWCANRDSDGYCLKWVPRWKCTKRACNRWEERQVCTNCSGNDYENGDICIKKKIPQSCKVWKKRLWVSNPSRMAVLKNVLGNSVDLWLDYQPPDPFPFSADWNASLPEVAWIKDYSSSQNYGYYIEKRIKYTDYHLDPGDPAPLRNAAGDRILGTFRHQLPLDLVGTSADSVDWGLITFGRKINGNLVNVLESVDPANNAAVVASIEDYMRLKKYGGLNVDKKTPTRTATNLAGEELNTLFENAADCGQTYGTILITDGQSNIGNTGNPADTEWNSCASDASTTWPNYPPGSANTAWDQFIDSNNVGPRTWVIGVSEDVGSCELDWTAFMGRTDASSPLGDSGFAIDDDPYLERDADTNVGTFDDAHGHYAYFSNSAAELKAAFDSILAGMGAGDYATSAPAVAGGGTVHGNMALLASSDYPSWQGHLRAFTQEDDPNNPGQQYWMELWDSGEVLADSASPNGGYARKIYTWDANLDLIEIAADGSTASELNTLCGDCGIDTEVVDFIRGNDGNGVARPWALGALINTTPAVVGPVSHWAGGYILAHEDFEQAYAERHTSR